MCVPLAVPSVSLVLACRSAGRIGKFMIQDPPVVPVTGYGIKFTVPNEESQRWRLENLVARVQKV